MAHRAAAIDAPEDPSMSSSRGCGVDDTAEARRDSSLTALPYGGTRATTLIPRVYSATIAAATQATASVSSTAVSPKSITTTGRSCARLRDGRGEAVVLKLSLP